MISFITRYFSSLWSLITWPFRAIWRVIVRIFPPREVTFMDTPTGNVYAFNQSSFWRFTKFCGKFGLIIWATWSTYIFVHYRPLIQTRTLQLAEARATHARQMSDLQVYLEKYNNLTRELNLIDDKILNAKKLTDAEKEELMNSRLKTWGELDFLHTRVADMFADEKYTPEYKKTSEMSVEYELMRAKNDELLNRNALIVESMQRIAEADSVIIDRVSTLTDDNLDDLREQLKTIKSTIIALGINETALMDAANNYKGPLVGAAVVPLEFDSEMDPKYQKLAADINLWSGMTRMSRILPLGTPVAKMTITSNYGNRKDPFTGKQKMHRGIDFAGKIGTELLAVAPGRVISAGERVGYGSTVEIDHGLGFTTLYAHLSHINVSRGDYVRPGTIVGLGGSSGRSTGPHLHYEIRYKGSPFNPITFVKE